MNANLPVVLVVDGLRIQENESLLKAEKLARQMVLERGAVTAVVYVPKRIVTRTPEGTRTQHVRGNGRKESPEPVYTYDPVVIPEEVSAA